MMHDPLETSSTSDESSVSSLSVDSLEMSFQQSKADRSSSEDSDRISPKTKAWFRPSSQKLPQTPRQQTTQTTSTTTASMITLNNLFERAYGLQDQLIQSKETVSSFFQLLEDELLFFFAPCILQSGLMRCGGVLLISQLHLCFVSRSFSNPVKFTKETSSFNQIKLDDFGLSIDIQVILQLGLQHRVKFGRNILFYFQHANDYLLARDILNQLAEISNNNTPSKSFRHEEKATRQIRFFRGLRRRSKSVDNRSGYALPSKKPRHLRRIHSDEKLAIPSSYLPTRLFVHHLSFRPADHNKSDNAKTLRRSRNEVHLCKAMSSGSVEADKKPAASSQHTSAVTLQRLNISKSSPHSLPLATQSAESSKLKKSPSKHSTGILGFFRRKTDTLSSNSKLGIFGQKKSPRSKTSDSIISPASEDFQTSIHTSATTLTAQTIKSVSPRSEDKSRNINLTFTKSSRKKASTMVDGMSAKDFQVSPRHMSERESKPKSPERNSNRSSSFLKNHMKKSSKGRQGVPSLEAVLTEQDWDELVLGLIPEVFIAGSSIIRQCNTNPFLFRIVTGSCTTTQSKTLTLVTLSDQPTEIAAEQELDQVFPGCDWHNFGERSTLFIECS
eukprot:TRINITY_DN8751_c0_g1_i1.p1 TRINITY_DN8751_c0_g1~~TRINITY_DN8751_c0_g1_i1.p1  ORF type:complete len:614 (-),score=110.57 TRINITY_DN8751_c0_g1_i1:340-2181(-)